jgi:hypothetical protein
MSARPLSCFASPAVDFPGMRCGACGLQWEHNDLDPPTCGKGGRRRFPIATQMDIAPALARTGGATEAVVPLELPERLALRMAMAYESGATPGGAPSVAGMRLAWRVFLDESL